MKNIGSKRRENRGDERADPAAMNDRRMTIADRWMVALTAVIAVGGIVSAIIFDLQLHAMKGQLTEMQGQMEL
jgi:hypothetical protein